MYTIAKRVQRGIDVLNEFRPGWYAEIDLERLDIASGEDCVLGQLAGGYPAGTCYLPGDRVAERNGGFSGLVRYRASLGFSLYIGIDNDVSSSFKALTKEWRRRISMMT